MGAAESQEVKKKHGYHQFVHPNWNGEGFLFYFGENDSSSLCYFCGMEGIMTFLVLYTRKSF